MCSQAYIKEWISNLKYERHREYSTLTSSITTVEVVIIVNIIVIVVLIFKSRRQTPKPIVLVVTQGRNQNLKSGSGWRKSERASSREVLLGLFVVTWWAYRQTASHSIMSSLVFLFTPECWQTLTKLINATQPTSNHRLDHFAMVLHTRALHLCFSVCFPVCLSVFFAPCLSVCLPVCFPVCLLRYQPVSLSDGQLDDHLDDFFVWLFAAYSVCWLVI